MIKNKEQVDILSCSRDCFPNKWGYIKGRPNKTFTNNSISQFTSWKNADKNLSFSLSLPFVFDLRFVVVFFSSIQSLHCYSYLTKPKRKKTSLGINNTILLLKAKQKVKSGLFDLLSVYTQNSHKSTEERNFQDKNRNLSFFFEQLLLLMGGSQRWPQL